MARIGRNEQTDSGRGSDGYAERSEFMLDVDMRPTDCASQKALCPEERSGGMFSDTPVVGG